MNRREPGRLIFRKEKDKKGWILRCDERWMVNKIFRRYVQQRKSLRWEMVKEVMVFYTLNCGEFLW